MFNHPIPDYSIYFRILTAQSGWNDTTLRGVFSQGLPDDLKEELAMREVSGNLEALIILVTRLKNRLQERRRQRESERAVKSSRSVSRLRGSPHGLLSLCPHSSS